MTLDFGLIQFASAWALADPDLAAEQLRALAERAMRRNIRIAFEAVPSGRWVRSYQQAWSIVERAAHPHLGLLVDGFNTFSHSGDLSGLRDLPGDRLFFVRVADAQRGSTDGSFAFGYRNLPAQGDLDVVGFLEQVLLTGYSGTISLARGNDVLRATPNRRTGWIPPGTAGGSSRPPMAPRSGLASRARFCRAGRCTMPASSAASSRETSLADLPK